jgi:hypothetical protein
MNESLLTNETDTNVTKETEASLSYEEHKPSKKVATVTVATFRV